MTNIILNSERLKSIPTISEIRKGHQLLPLLFNIVLEILDRALGSKDKRHP